MVKNDTEKVIKNLIHDESIIVWHDYAVNPEMIRFEVLAAILDGTPKEFHSYLYHVSNTKSAILFKEKLEAKALEGPVTPEFYYKIRANYQLLDND